ncbi:MAG: hypothetical protein PHW18_03420 [Sulfuricurvum sp.]|uniref:hypothetical protein n=1 Tax=Sulfuricurvum sp. TaxID=2025608 RepID=UPI00261FA754|nr:hypothetical protein [Sulfuricurvum sp.]MDD2828607.1 hypothetical protein [Sulfuricurvum sp.]MDD4948284.1 hypothetical protein [Sulfuricurvum sp.]
MKKQPDMLDEYDFSKGVRGKYASEYHQGVNIVKIDEDVTKVFPDSKSVNEALRTLMRLLAKNHEMVQSA